MCAFALFFLQDPSVLEFQRRFQDQLRTNKLNATFGVAQIPADSQFRDLLDSHDYEPLLDCFGDWIGRMQDAKWLQHYQFLDGRYLITMDGSQYFSSYKVNCECCLTATKNGTVRYHHDILQTAIVHPDIVRSGRCCRWLPGSFTTPMTLAPRMPNAASRTVK